MRLSRTDNIPPHLKIFQPLRFLQQCPDELKHFLDYVPLFEAKNTKMVISIVRKEASIKDLFGKSTYSCFSKAVSLPVLIDEKGTLAKAYQVITQNKQITFRALFLIDEKGIVRQEIVNDLEISRSAEEMLRVLVCLDQFKEIWGDQKSY